MPNATESLSRIGIFYDGNFFFHVSNYYTYHHDRRARISVSGLHEFVRHQVADAISSDVRFCQIVDAHYFRGRPRAIDADQRGSLLRERIFDDVLVREGVVTHYLPLGPDGEKGIDVWLALEAYELAIYKRFDIVVLVACDGDFLPLVRKLNTLGTRVMLTAWDFKFVDRNGVDKETRTAQVLLEEVTYPVMMHQIIEDRSRRSDPLITGLFVPVKEAKTAGPFLSVVPSQKVLGTERMKGSIQSLKSGFGFISPFTAPSKPLFFFHSEVVNADFNNLQPGTTVTYSLGTNEKGPCAVDVEVVSSSTS